MSIRTERLGSVIQKDLGEILQRNYQPSGSFITVTRVKMTDDLSIAKVYLSIFAPGRDEGPIYQQIDNSQDEIRFELASRIKNQVRRIPELLFYEDDTAEYVNRMEHLFNKAKASRSDSDTDEDSDQQSSR
ncbi:30S ribosome-binding factor RbfA [Rhodohalobacter mucosus]|uniref:Ribosome-binding factor A n=1 Tax=Rhodohalobacter mucosus TaxID=2079485 RepID=A0A316U156_9BACT|nr:30S ribosome-binding factor RbfA [Rhodohalobacter mucosus]PWN06576.1 30S ribosome-binding factor RbfA [Rhodohalobacter mucosus]